MFFKKKTGTMGRLPVGVILGSIAALALWSLVVPGFYPQQTDKAQAVNFTSFSTVGGSSRVSGKIKIAQKDNVFYMAFVSTTPSNQGYVYITTSSDGVAWGQALPQLGPIPLDEDNVAKVSFEFVYSSQFGGFFALYPASSTLFVNNNSQAEITSAFSATGFSWSTSSLNAITAGKCVETRGGYGGATAPNSSLSVIACGFNDPNTLTNDDVGILIATSTNAVNWTSSTPIAFPSTTYDRPPKEVQVRITGGAGSEVIHLLYPMNYQNGGTAISDIYYASSTDRGVTFTSQKISGSSDPGMGTILIDSGLGFDVDENGRPAAVYPSYEALSFGGLGYLATGSIYYAASDQVGQWTRSTITQFSGTASQASLSYPHSLRFYSGTSPVVFTFATSMAPIVFVNTSTWHGYNVENDNTLFGSYSSLSYNTTTARLLSAYYINNGSSNGVLRTAVTALQDADLVLGPVSGASVDRVGPTSVRVNWTDTTNETGYRISIYSGSTTSTLVTSTVVSANATSTTITGLSEGTAYNARVFVVNLHGDSTGYAAGTITTLAKPANLTIDAVSTTAIEITWDDGSLEDGYITDFATGTDTTVFPTQNQALHASGTTSVTSTGLAVNTRYVAAVASYNAYGTSTRATSSPFYTLASVPTGLSGSAVSQTSVSLSWIGDGSDYMVRNETTSLDDRRNSSATSTTVTGLSCGTSYTFKVKAYNGDSVDTAYSSSIVVATAACPVSTGGGSAANRRQTNRQATETPGTDGSSGSGSSSSCALDVDRVYKTPDSSAVYYVTPDCTKRAFKDAVTYFSYFTSWSAVQETPDSLLSLVQDDTLGFMPWGPLYNPQYGAIVKTPSDPKVYLLLNDTKSWITSAVVFERLYTRWDWIEDIDVRLLDKYATGSLIDYLDHHPNYTIVKYENDPKVYRLEPDPSDATKQVKRHIASEAAFSALGFRWDRIVTISDSEVYPTGAELTR